MKNYRKERSFGTVAALLLFAVFAAGILSVLLSGGKLYRALAQRDAAAYDSRTCSQYLLSKLRSAPDPDAVSILAFGGTEALQITQTIAGERYVTRIYCHDGWLTELFSLADGEFSPEDGEKILPASDLSLTRQQDLLVIGITDGNGQEMILRHALRGWEGTP